MSLNLFSDRDFYANIQAEVQKITTHFHLERFSLHWFEEFRERGHKFCPIYGMTFTTISN